jgi:hypothetical protein
MTPATTPIARSEAPARTAKGEKPADAASTDANSRSVIPLPDQKLSRAYSISPELIYFRASQHGRIELNLDVSKLCLDGIKTSLGEHHMWLLRDARGDDG